MSERAELLTVEEAAERLSVGRTTAFNLVASGELASVKVGRLRRVPAQAVERYIDSLMNQQAVA